MIPRFFVALLCAFAASSKENVCAISASVRTRSIALLNNLMASSELPLRKTKKIVHCECSERHTKIRIKLLKTMAVSYLGSSLRTNH